MSVTLTSSKLNSRRFLGSVSQGAVNAPIDVPRWGADVPASGTINVTLTVNMGPAGGSYAPHVVIVDASATNFAGENLSTPEWDAAFHRLSYMQFSGDPDAGLHRFPERLNIKERGVSPAQRSAYVYRNPGTYTHSAFVCDMEGNFGWASTTITIDAPNYAPANIVIVAPDNNFAHAPFCLPVNRVTTWAAAVARLDAIGAGSGPRALMLKRGTTITPSSTYTLNNVDVLAWGLGAKPILNMPATVGVPSAAFRAAGGRMKIQNIDVHGPWDPVAEMSAETGEMSGYLGNMQQGTLLEGASGNGGHILIDQCDGSNVYGAFAYISLTSGGVGVMSDCHFKDFKDFFHFGDAATGSAMAFLGNGIAQNPQAASGGLPRWFLNPEVAGDAGWYPNNSHSGSRTPVAVGVLYNGNDMFARHGWTTQEEDIYVTNSPIRLNSGGGSGARAWVVNNWIEGPVDSYNAAGSTMGWVAYMFEFNTIVKDPTAGSCVSNLGSGVTARNNLFIVGETDDHLTALMGAVIGSGGGLAAPTTARVEYYSNTVVDLYRSNQHAAGFAPFKVGASVTGYLEENNVYYAPNLTTPNIADGPLAYPADVEGSLPEPRYLGRRKTYEYWPNHYTLPANVAQGQSFTMPYRADRLGIITTQASFSGHWGKHNIRVGAALVRAVAEEMDVVFGPSGITITNKTTTTWPSGASITAWLHRGKTAMAMQTQSAVKPGAFDLGWTTPASGAYASATSGLVAPFDLRGRPRRGGPHPNAVAGVPSRGACEVLA